MWWIVAFATAMVMIELWARDSGDVAFHAALALFLAVPAMTQGRPLGWLRAAQWTLIVLSCCYLWRV